MRILDGIGSIDNASSITIVLYLYIIIPLMNNVAT